jgi:hypothetical protein
MVWDDLLFVGVADEDEMTLLLELLFLVANCA